VEGVSVTVPEQVLVKLDWSEAEDSPAPHVNQALAQLGPPSGRGVPDGIYVALGSVLPPLIPPDEEARAARVAELQTSVLKVAVHARVHLSREVLGDLIHVLQVTAQQHDAAVETAKQAQASEQV
jgi:hypothetical protein